MFCVVLFHHVHNVVFFLGKRKIVELMWERTTGSYIVPTRTRGLGPD